MQLFVSSTGPDQIFDASIIELKSKKILLFQTFYVFEARKKVDAVMLCSK